ncbi:MAG: ribonuclease P protein component [Pseudomonadota bacterium]
MAVTQDPTNQTSPGRAPVETLRKRADFLAAARARRVATRGFVLQGRRRSASGPARIGYTCSKKVGNAVARNHAKRRLRAIAQAVLPTQAKPGWDYVLIGRHGHTSVEPFADLLQSLERALEKVHG